MQHNTQLVNAETEHCYGSNRAAEKRSVINANGFNNISIVYVSEIQSNNGSQIDKFSHGLDDKINQRNCPCNRVNNIYEKPKLFLALSDSLF